MSAQELRTLVKIVNMKCTHFDWRRREGRELSAMSEHAIKLHARRGQIITPTSHTKAIIAQL